MVSWKLMLHAMHSNSWCSVWAGMRMCLSLTLICILSTAVTLWGSWSLYFSSFMRVNSLAVLSYCTTLTGTATNCSNWKIVMLLQFHIDVTLVQHKFASFIKLLVKWFVVMIYVNLWQIMQKAIVSMTWFRVVKSFITIVLSLYPHWNCLCGRLSICCAHSILVQMWIIVRKLPAVSRLNIRLRALSPTLACRWFHWCLAWICNKVLSNYFRISIFSHIIVCKFCCHSSICICWFQILSST